MNLTNAAYKNLKILKSGKKYDIGTSMKEIINTEKQELIIEKAAAQIINEGFKSAGIKEGDEFKALGELLKAKKMTLDKFGDEHWENDNTAIRGGIELVLRLRRLLDNKVEDIKDISVTHKISSEDINRLESIAKELKGLESRLVTDKIQQGEIIDVVCQNK